MQGTDKYCDSYVQIIDGTLTLLKFATKAWNRIVSCASLRVKEAHIQQKKSEILILKLQNA